MYQLTHTDTEDQDDKLLETNIEHSAMLLSPLKLVDEWKQPLQTLSQACKYTKEAAYWEVPWLKS
jgi:hypothetical protein